MNKKTILLTKAGFFNLLGSNQKSKKKASSPLFTILLQIAIFTYLGILYAGEIKTAPLDMVSSYISSTFSFMNMMLIFLGISLSPNVLFGFKDGDFLLALPVSKKDILLSKFFTFLAYLYIYNFSLVLPSIFIVGNRLTMGVPYYIMGIVGLLFFPFVPATIASLLGLLIRKISAGKKYEAYLQSLYLFPFVLMLVFQQQLIATNVLDQYSPQVGLFLDAILNQDYLKYILFIGLSCLILYLFFLFFTRTIFKVNATMQSGYHVKNFKAAKTKRTSIRKALYTREIKRFFGIPAYVFNQGLGLIMMVGFSIYLLINPEFVAEVFKIVPGDGFKASMSLAVLVIITSLCYLVVVNASSISLESNKLWILKSLPIRVKDIFQAKLLCNASIIFIPTSISWLVLSTAVFQASITIIFVGLLLIAFTAISVSATSLYINLCFPMLDYEREIVAIKQSKASFVSIIVNEVLMFANVFSFFNLVFQEGVDPFHYVLGLTGVTALIAIIALLALSKSGVKKWNAIN